MATPKDRFRAWLALVAADIKSLRGRVPPSGGIAATILKKASGTNYDYTWGTIGWSEVTGKPVTELSISITETGYRYIPFISACTLSNLQVLHAGTAPSLSWDLSTNGTTWTSQTINSGTVLNIPAGAVLRLNVVSFSVFATACFKRTLST